MDSHFQYPSDFSGCIEHTQGKEQKNQEARTVLKSPTLGISQLAHVGLSSHRVTKADSLE